MIEDFLTKLVVYERRHSLAGCFLDLISGAGLRRMDIFQVMRGRLVHLNQ
jgi:hypothetical protein